MVVKGVEIFPHPVVVLAEQPYFYTGTLWKLDNLNNSWKALQKSRAWERAERALGIKRPYAEPEQLAVPAEEPDHLLQQQDLVYGKTINQITVLLAALEEEKPKAKVSEVIIPDTLREQYQSGAFSIAFINTDVGNMHHYEHKPWNPLRNFYVAPKLQTVGFESRLAKRLNNYWKEEYVAKLGSENGSPYVRSIESGMTLTQIVYQRTKSNNSLPSVRDRIFPGVSSVGLKLERSPLTTNKGRRNVIEFLIESNSNSPKLAQANKNALSVTHGRAGGIKTEDLYTVAVSLGIHAELLTHGSTQDEKMSSLLEHVEGPPLELFRQLILTLAHAPDCELHNVAGVAEFGPKRYPPGMKKHLTL